MHHEFVAHTKPLFHRKATKHQYIFVSDVFLATLHHTKLHCTVAFTKHGVIGKIFFVKKYLITPSVSTPQSTEVPYLDHGEAENEPIEKVYVTTLVTPMGLFNYVDGINSKITPKK